MPGKSDADTDVIPRLAPPAAPGTTSTSAFVQADLGGLSHPGKVRPKNEDHFFVARFDRSMRTLLTNLPSGCVPDRYGETLYGMLVADGMGGHAGGEVASRTAISVLVDLVLQTPDWIMRFERSLLDEVRLRMERRFQQVQEALTEQAQDDPSPMGMGTTMTLGGSLGADFILLHTGDSRAYLFRQDRLHRLTSDHTLAQSLADVGVIRPDEVSRHPLRHVLTHVLGGRDGPVRVEWDHFRLEDGDQILLCTDGLTDMVPDEGIAQTLRSAGTAAAACQTLLDLALESGGKDNVTVIVGRYQFTDEG